MTHPILEPLVVQLPDNATSRKLIESGGDYVIISNDFGAFYAVDVLSRKSGVTDKRIPIKDVIAKMKALTNEVSK